MYNINTAEFVLLLIVGAICGLALAVFTNAVVWLLKTRECLVCHGTGFVTEKGLLTVCLGCNGMGRVKK